MHALMLAAALAAAVIVIAPYALWAWIIAWELIKHPPK
jgi:hypothetical protein